jgi:type VI protein secretion system component VasK
MESANLAAVEWRVVALAVLVGVLLIWGLVVLLRANRKDRASLEESLAHDRDDDEAGKPS